MLATVEELADKLQALIEAQDQATTGCQAVYSPMATYASEGPDAQNWIIQIALRAPTARLNDATKFTSDAEAILRDGGRRLLIRRREVSSERDFEKDEQVTRGYLRLIAFDAVGDVETWAEEPEMVTIQ